MLEFGHRGDLLLLLLFLVVFRFVLCLFCLGFSNQVRRVCVRGAQFTQSSKAIYKQGVIYGS